ncbi:unnamed protein product [Microthlaspi erraticum]|uniref:Factor of DNA methylation 1-5/IDN2 domain-containing protein n=1 Tax=Microthlaspi erraticum TaxID=1685480 RepID=A0A6D2JIZ6_9BRAS|nr:unnamed protein product [Microthlaspi erraticum]
MKKNGEEKYVWPWVGVVANVPTEIFKDLKTPYERSFEQDRHGKKDWKNNGIHTRGEKLYGWVAREEDYNSWGIVGEKVKKGRDLRSISQIEEGEKRQMNQLVDYLSQTIEKNEKRKEVLEHENNEASLVLEGLELHNLQLHRTYQEGVKKEQQLSFFKFRKRKANVLFVFDELFGNMNQDLMTGENIRVKRLGQLHPETFLPEMMWKHRGSISRAENEGAELCSLWEAQIGDVQWHPFKILESDRPPNTTRKRGYCYDFFCHNKQNFVTIKS